MTATRQPKLEPDTTQSLAYWMGRVDATMSEMKTAIENFGHKTEAQWAEFDAWRRAVDNRLQEGMNRFNDHEERLENLENSKPAGDSNGSGRPKFGSWDWFRDGYLEKGMYIIISLALYKLIELIIQYWANSPN